MYGKKVKLRILFLFLVLASIILSVYLILKSLEENVVYFLSPSAIKNLNEIISMNGYGLYVWSAFSFTLLSFGFLFLVIKLQLLKEKRRFVYKFGSLNTEKAKVAKSQKINKEILVGILESKI